MLYLYFIFIVSFNLYFPCNILYIFLKSFKTLISTDCPNFDVYKEHYDLRTSKADLEFGAQISGTQHMLTLLPGHPTVPPVSCGAFNSLPQQLAARAWETRACRNLKKPLEKPGKK